MNRCAIYIVKGPQGGGKTTWILELVRILLENGLEVRGIIAERHSHEGEPGGFNLTDPATGVRIPLADLVTGDRQVEVDRPVRTGARARQPVRVGRYIFHESAVRKGNNIIRRALKENCDVIVFDEIGAAEMKGLLWAHLLEKVLETFRGILVITVRDRFADQVTDRWALEPAGVFDISGTTADSAAGIIITHK